MNTVVVNQGIAGHTQQILAAKGDNCAQGVQLSVPLCHLIAGNTNTWEYWHEKLHNFLVAFFIKNYMWVCEGILTLWYQCITNLHLTIQNTIHLPTDGFSKRNNCKLCSSQVWTPRAGEHWNRIATTSCQPDDMYHGEFHSKKVYTKHCNTYCMDHQVAWYLHNICQEKGSCLVAIIMLVQKVTSEN